MRLLIISLFIFLSGCSFVDKLVVSNLYPFKQVNEAYPTTVAPEDMSEIMLDKKINAWVYDNHSSEVALIVAHGNGENLEALNKFGFLNKLKSLGVSFIIFDYPGLGKSQGVPDEKTVTEATSLAFDFAKNNWHEKSLVFFGRSLGAAAVMQATKKIDQLYLDGVILVSPWASMYEAAVSLNSMAKGMSKKTVALHSYKSEDAAKLLKVKSLVIHGDKDTLIPYSHGERVSKALNGRLYTAIGYGHNDVFTSEKVWDEIVKFLKETL